MLASADTIALDMAFVGGACCDARDGACLTSRWRLVGADKIPGCVAAAGPPSLFKLKGPSSSFLFHLLFLLFGYALQPIAAIFDASTTGGHLELPRRESSTGCDRLPERSEPASARKGAAPGVMEVVVPFGRVCEVVRRSEDELEGARRSGLTW
jgi:hypothetical protein